MTCIVGLVDKGMVWMGGDSCGSDDWQWMETGATKVFKAGDVLCGVSGSFKIIDLLTYHLPDLAKTAEDPDRFLRTTFMRNFFDIAHKFHWNEHEDPPDFDVLIGYAGKLYLFQDDFSIANIQTSGFAIGSGGLTARGSLHTTKDMKMPPAKRIALALHAAEAVVHSVRGPFKILNETGTDKLPKVPRKVKP